MARIGPLLAVAIGGAAGSLTRWGMLSLTADEWATITIFAINAVGSLLLGVVIGQRERMTNERFRLLGTGFAGGITTFSGYAVSIAVALEDGHLSEALINGLGTVVVALMAGGIGFRLSRLAGVALISRSRRQQRSRRAAR